MSSDLAKRLACAVCEGARKDGPVFEQTAQSIDAELERIIHEDEPSEGALARAERGAFKRIYCDLLSRLEAALTNAAALGLFAENHRKFVSAWSSVRAYLRENEDCAVVAMLGPDQAWKLVMQRDHGIASEAGCYSELHVFETLYEETRFDYQSAPCPTLLASWCERQLELAREQGKG